MKKPKKRLSDQEFSSVVLRVCIIIVMIIMPFTIADATTMGDTQKIMLIVLCISMAIIFTASFIPRIIKLFKKEDDNK